MYFENLKKIKQMQIDKLLLENWRKNAAEVDNEADIDVIAQFNDGKIHILFFFWSAIFPLVPSVFKMFFIFVLNV